MKISTTPRPPHHDPAEREFEFPSDITHEKLIEVCRGILERARRTLEETNRTGSSRAACVRYARHHDALIKSLYKYLLQKWESSEKGAPGSLAIVALGGYGRRDLSLRSDVDVMFLVGEKHVRQEEFIKELIYILFDLNLDLGYSVRRVPDCLNIVGTDIQSATAMIEGRHIIGSKPLFQQFHEFFYQSLRSSRGKKWFLQAIYEEWSERRQKYDDSIYLIQPNLKESRGGLRDLHSVRWAIAAMTGSTELTGLTELGIVTEAELKRYRQAEDFIIMLRNELHSLAPRKNDVLNFEAQIEITKRLDYKPTETMLAPEVMMHEYYNHARLMAKFSDRAFLTLMHREKSILGSMLGTLRRKKLDKHFMVQGDVLFLSDAFPDYFKEDPERIMAAFARACKSGLRISERTRDRIEKVADSLGEEFQESPACAKHFMEIMESPHGVARTLEDMHDCGILCAYLPEFERVRCMVRMDHYHRYTVDEHLIKCVENFERLLNEPSEKRSQPARIAQEIQRRDLLNFSLLVHDVGKGYGKGHALLGGQLVQRMGNRMGLPAEDVEILRFLVLSHLKIGHISQRRDLEDPKTGRDLAEEVGTLERLNLLYVHSVCDAMGVSPDSWTDWKARLFEAAYYAGAAALQGRAPGEQTVEHPHAQFGQRIWDHISQNPPEDFPSDVEEVARLRKRLDDFLETVPSRYLQMMRIEVVAQHFLMMTKLDEKERVDWRLNEGIGASEIVTVSADIPGSFARICGAIAAKEINILSAQIFSTSDGYGINVFQVTDLNNQALPEGFRLERARAELNQVFLGKKTMEEFLEKYKTRSTPSKPPAHPRPAEVRLDNDASQQFTVLEVRTYDRPGLLYQIASFLDEQKLNINRAMVSTEAYGVIDVFYVTDLEYNKIHDPSRINRIQTELATRLDLQSSFIPSS